MALFNSESRPAEITVIVVLIALLLLLPPILGIWATTNSPWYLPYLIWLGIIALSFCLQWILRKHAV